MQQLGKYTARHAHWRLVDSLVCWLVGRVYHRANNEDYNEAITR